MVTVIRSVLAVLAGLVVAFVVVAGGEFLGMKFFPVPQEVDVSTPDAIKTAMEQGRIPTGALASVVAAWAVAAVAGSWVAPQVATRAKLTHGMVFGAIFLATTIANLSLLPHPLWMWVLGVLVVLPAAYVGARLALPRNAASIPREASESA
jgi:hypothetical protein